MTKQPYRIRIRQELASIHPLYARPGMGEEAIKAAESVLAKCEAENVSPRKCARLVMAAHLASSAA